MEPNFEAFLRVGELDVPGVDVEFLRSIAREGSLNAAADALGRSYSQAHARVAELEGTVGPLVERRRGGSGGGGSRLTDRARRLISRFERLTAALEGTAMTEKVELTGDVAARDGALAVVDTPVGRLQALLTEPAERARVTLRADSVTLYDPEGVPDAAASSARNRFAGSVVDVDSGESTATVSVDIGAESPLAVRITTESLDELDIATGDRVVAVFKATATRATPLW